METWKAVPGFEGLYEVSDLGRVRSLDRTIWCEGSVKGGYWSRKPGRVLRPGAMNSGHLTVCLGRTEGSRCVHELVALAFLGPRPVGREIRHLDGNEKNNAIGNLQYATRGRNSQDKKWHRGAKNYRLSPDAVSAIKTRLALGWTGAACARLWGVAESTISAIKHGRFHKDVRASY